MASKTAILSVRIISDAQAARAGFKDAEQATKEFESSLNTASVAAGVALAGITAIGVQAVQAASDLQQSAGAMEAVFGAHSDAIGQLAEDSARRVGLAQSEYQQLAAVLGAQLKNLGIEEENLVSQTDDLLTMGADLAAVFNGSTSEAVGALSALMRGERDPIERYGVTIKQAGVNAKLAEMGLDGLEGKARTTAEAQATLALLSEQTGHAVGQFSAEMDTAAVASQVAGALWQDAAADLGEALLPFVVQGAELLSSLAETFQQNSDVLVPLLLIVGGFVAIMAALVLGIKAYRTVVEVAAAAQVLWNVAMTANPIGILIAAIAALIGFIVLIAVNWEEVQVIWGDAIGAMIGWIEDLINWVIDAINWVAQLFGAAGDLGNVDWGLGREARTMAVTMDAGAPLAARAMSFAAPAAFAAPASFGPTSAQLVASPRGAAAPVQNITSITDEGALDADAVARQIRDMLARLGKTSGTVSVGGNRWNPSTSR